MKQAFFTAMALVLAGCGAPAVPVSPEAPAAAPVATYELQAIRSVGKHKGDYLPAHNFKVEIDGVVTGGFRRAMGPGTHPADYRNGDDPLTHKRADRAKVITDRDTGRSKSLRLVLDADSEAAKVMLTWYKLVLAGKTERKSISIIFLNDAGEETARVTYKNSRPFKYTQAVVNVRSAAPATVTVDFNWDVLILS